MARWELFLGATAVIVILVLTLSRASESLIADVVEARREEPAGESARIESTVPEAETGADAPEAVEPFTTGETDGAIEEHEATHRPEAADRNKAADTAEPAAATDSGPALTSELLLVNVALSQGLFAALLVAVIWYTAIPADALGIGAGVLTGGEAVGVGILVGLVLYLGSEGGGRLAERVGLDRHEHVREVLAPDDRRGWVGLLVVVLPLIAVFEELLFRAVLIGAISAGFDVPIWALVIGSSAVFAAGHGAQGRAGIVVTGVLGVLLGVVFVLTWSLLAVVVAHYVVNALEFVVHEWFGVE